MLDKDYANADFIPDGASYPAKWAQAAKAFRSQWHACELDVPYGPGQPNAYDFFHPERSSKGTVIFVHGGYWKAFGKSDFSHLATGAVQAGYGCALIGYTLAPEARIAGITQEVALAIDAIARRTVGPLYLVGHSAGGHLVARMVCADIAPVWRDRVAHVMPISPVGDLAPLMQTTMNDILQIDSEEAAAESPTKLARADVPVTVWVGGAERPVFLEQANSLAEAWACAHVLEPDKHHFDVIDGLLSPERRMMQTLLQL